MKPNALTSCQTKKAYNTREAAEDTALYLWAEHEVNVYTYKCQLCEQWHLSSRK